MPLLSKSDAPKGPSPWCMSLWCIFLAMDFSRGAIEASESQALIIDQILKRFQNFGTFQMVLPFAVYAVVRYARRIDGSTGKQKALTGGISLLFGLLNAFSQHMYHTDSLPARTITVILMYLYAVSCAILFYYSARIFLHLLPRTSAERPSERWDITNRRLFLISFSAILFCWLPWIISYYPCSAEWDVYEPITQYLGQATKIDHHPWFYCSTVGFFYQTGVRLGDKNLGIFIYILLRDLAASAIYAHLIVRLKEHGVRKNRIIAVLLFFAVVPVWGAYAKHAFKDTIGAALFCWFMTEAVQLTTAIREGKSGFRDYFRYSLTVLFMSLFRKNCIWVAVPVTVLFAFAVIKNKGFVSRGLKAKRCAILALGIVLYGGYQIYIQKVEHVAPGNAVEALSIPLQQTARTVRDHQAEITPEEKEALSRVLDYDRISEAYDPILSDPIKQMSHDRSEGKYYQTWARMFFRFPQSYFEAALAQSYGYYAFVPDQAPGAGNENAGMTIWNWTKDRRFDDELTFDYLPGTDKARTILDEWAKLWHQIPLLGLTDVKAVYTWLIVLTGILMIRQKRRIMLIPWAGYIIMILTCCASPVNDCFRYFAPVAAAAPAILLFPEARTADKLQGD